MLLTLIIIGTGVGGALLLLSLVVTNPTTLGPAGVTLWFLLLGLTLAGGLTLLLSSVKRLLLRPDSPGRRLSASARQGGLLAAWLVVLAALASLRQLAARDVLLTGILFALIEFYLRTRSSGSNWH